MERDDFLYIPTSQLIYYAANAASSTDKPLFEFTPNVKTALENNKCKIIDNNGRVGYVNASTYSSNISDDSRLSEKSTPDNWIPSYQDRITNLNGITRVDIQKAVMNRLTNSWTGYGLNRSEAFSFIKREERIMEARRLDLVNYPFPMDKSFQEILESLSENITYRNNFYRVDESVNNLLSSELIALQYIIKAASDIWEGHLDFVKNEASRDNSLQLPGMIEMLYEDEDKLQQYYAMLHQLFYKKFDQLINDPSHTKKHMLFNLSWIRRHIVWYSEFLRLRRYITPYIAFLFPKTYPEKNDCTAELAITGENRKYM